MYDGIIFQSPKFSTDDGKTHRFCLVVGRLTNDPKIQSYNKTKVSFNIKYYTDSYLNVVIWGDTDVSYAARTLEKGDTVLCAGTVTYSKYTVQKGPDKGMQKEWHDLNCQFLMAQSMVNCGIQVYSSANIQRLLNSEASDVMESLEDHADEEYGVGGYEVKSSTTDTEYEDDDDYEVTI